LYLRRREFAAKRFIRGRPDEETAAEFARGCHMKRVFPSQM
jgi:hypothetical protein